jgi:DNA ligase (NAD+)
MMGGVVIKRCSLYNIDMFKEMRYTKNCKVLLVRANDVIPKILKNISDGDSEFEIPLICPECGEKVEIKGKNLMCVNNFCSGLGIGNLKHWVNVLDIYELGPKIIEMLYTKGLVKEPADFYTLTIDKLIELDRMGEKSALTIIKNLKAKMEITLSQFISGLNIPNFGERTTISLIDAGYNEIEKIFNAQEKDLIKIKGIEVKTASQIIKGIKEKVNIINRLLEVGIKIKKLEKSKTVSNKFVDLSFCFTGTIQSIKTDGKRFTREDMHSIVISNGGKAEDSVRKGLTYLVMADPSSTSGKAQKAREIGVKLLSEIDFFNMIKE